MTRFNGSAVLKANGIAVNPDGSFREAEERLSVFVNRRNVGASAFMAARSAGLHSDAEVQLRSCDYAGQQELEMDGCEWTVERARNDGEFTVLTLARRASNEP